MDDDGFRSRRMAKSVIIFNLLPAFLLLLLICPVTALAGIPYTPSYILPSSQHNESIVYLLLSDNSGQKTQFLSLNFGADLDAANPQYTVLLDEVPFQQSNQSAFVPVVDDNGVIKVYAGNCHGTDQARVWEFRASNSSSTGNGTWDELPVNNPNGPTDGNLHGPNYLAAGFAFASSDTAASSIYTFGGMCPFTNTSGQNWVSAAKYSQSMTVLEPSEPPKNTSYEIATTGDRAPPIAEAGFTMTPLYQTSTTTSSGGVMQQQSILLIGGHTHNAFLNMSALAIFSLPQNGWSFVTAGSEPRRMELAIRDTVKLEPRSGHSAVLTSDGSKVIVFGGWVGKTSVPAEPQLAVLEIGEEYGGAGPWKWTIPPTEGIGLAKGTGVYGHGATMLPGGVMMIAGGYTISPSPKRATSESLRNSQVYLYNVTSNSWVDSYTNPIAQTGGPSTAHSGSLSSGQKAGLGVGLGIGLPASFGLVLFCWVLIRKRRARQRRDQHIRKLAFGAERSHFWAREEQNLTNNMHRLQMKQIGAWGPGREQAYPWAGNRGHFGRPTWRDTGESVAERTGLLVDVPSPTRNSRQSFSAKICRDSGQYNEFRRSDATGDIHPIDEREEYEASVTDCLVPPSQRPDIQSLDFGDAPDIFADAPFLTPQSTNFGVLLDTARENSRLAIASGARAVDGHSSSDRDNNGTPSNLSDLSTQSTQTSSEGIPQQARAVVFTKPSGLSRNGRPSPKKSALHSTDGKETCPNSAHSSMAVVEKCQSEDSFSTANTTLSQRQGESEHLLADVPETEVPSESPSKKSPSSKPKTSDWIGNIRRVLSVSKRNPTLDPDVSFAPVASGIDRRSTVIVASKPSNTKKDATPPRRAISASAELFRRKQGARDWGAARPSRGATFRTPKSTRDDFALPLDGGDEEEDWDIETAAEGRSVQVTFTVPKEKLRVVNATDGDMDNISEKSISRNSSKVLGTRASSR